MQSCKVCVALVYVCATFSQAVFALQPINDIAQSPLQLTPTVETNIMILFDDSGSMDFEIMTADALSSGLFFAPHPDGRQYGSSEEGLQIKQREGCELVTAAFGGYAYAARTSLNKYVPDVTLGSDKKHCYVAHEQAWRFRCSSFNSLYYDPEQTYLPWPGLRSDGSAFMQVNISAAPVDPYQADSETVNIESPDPALTGINNFRYYTCSLDENNNFKQDSEVIIGVDTPAQIKQNFANWFSYYRSRHLRAKGLLGNFIASQNRTQIGLTQLNQAVPSLEIQAMNDSLEDQGAKRNLLEALYSLGPDEMTGSRIDNLYLETARYLGCQSSNIFPQGADCPAEASPAGTCQPNHIIFATDGFQDGFLFSFDTILDEDSGTSNKFTGEPFSDAPSTGIYPLDISRIRTLSDVTVKSYKEDLQPSVPNEVQPTEADINRYPYRNSTTLAADDRLHQHIKSHAVTYDVALPENEALLLNFPSNTALNSQLPFKWLNPLESDIGLLQNLVHAVFSARGEMISATAASDESNNGVQTLTGLVAQGLGSTTPVAINTQGTSSDLTIYRTFYDSTSRSGDLTAQKIEINNDGNLNIESNVVNFAWSAAKQLDALVGVNGSSHLQRNVITYSGIANDGISFEYDQLDPLQQDQLRVPVPSSLDLARQRLEYLRGSTVNEGTSFDAGQFRIRPETDSTGGGVVHNAKLGTIANAAPVFVGRPRAAGRFGGAWPDTDGETYFDFQTSPNILNRDASIVVAANDGMFHVFDAETGNEKFAYVPALVYDHLSALTFPEYKPRFFVDSTPVVEDVYIRANGTGPRSWNTIVIGGLGAGGRGYYALDITDPDPYDDPAQQVLWEFAPEDDPDAYIDTAGIVRSDLGLSFSEPVIAMSNATDNGEQRWVAVFGNGYNNTGIDGKAVIYMLFIDRGIDGEWASSDLVKIDLGEDGIVNPNGIADVRAIDRDSNGTIDQLYAGDLFGNLHAVDISSSNPGDWNSASNHYILFEARYSQTNQRQPITTRPIVVNNEGGTTDDVIVVFATGSYFTYSDAINTEIQSIYGVVDNFSGNQVSAVDLTEQTLSNLQFVDTVNNNPLDVRILSSNPSTVTSKGWYIDFDVAPATGSGVEFPGEKAVREIQLRSGILFVNTVIPQQLNCGPAPGGFSLALNPQTGTAGEEVIFDINNDNVFDSDDNIDVATESKVIAGIRFKSTPSDSTFFGDYRITQLSNTDIDAILTNTAQTQLVGRQAWREVEF